MAFGTITVCAWKRVVYFCDLGSLAAVAQTSVALRHVAWTWVDPGRRVALLVSLILAHSCAGVNHPLAPWSERLTVAAIHLDLASLDVVLQPRGSRIGMSLLKEVLRSTRRDPSRVRRLELILRHAPFIQSYSDGCIEAEASEPDGLRVCSLLLRARRFYLEPSLWLALLSQPTRREHWFRLAKKHLAAPIFPCWAVNQDLFFVAMRHCDAAQRFFIDQVRGDNYAFQKLGKCAIMGDALDSSCT